MKRKSSSFVMFPNLPKKSTPLDHEGRSIDSSLSNSSTSINSMIFGAGSPVSVFNDHPSKVIRGANRVSPHACGGDSKAIEDLLSDSMGTFFKDGALTAHRSSEQWSMQEAMSTVCDAKNFEYGIFWALDPDAQVLVAKDKYSTPEGRVSGGRAGGGQGSSRSSSEVFCQTSVVLTTFPLGVGIPGRVMAHGGYEWCSNIQEDMRQLAEAGKPFFRGELAVTNGIKTIVCVAIPGVGVVELGSSLQMEEDVRTVDYVGTMCRPCGKDKGSTPRSSSCD